MILLAYAPKIVPESLPLTGAPGPIFAFLLKCRSDCSIFPVASRRIFLKFLASLQPLGLLLLRSALGIIFFSHGYPKLVHPANMQGFFVQHGLPAYFVYVSGVLELFGGGLLILGLFARPAALLLAVEMVVMLWKVYSGVSYLALREYEFSLILCVACFALATVGAGLISIDGLLLEGGASRSQSPRPFKKK
jgi:putative oxidoreductase